MLCSAYVHIVKGALKILDDDGDDDGDDDDDDDM